MTNQKTKSNNIEIFQAERDLGLAELIVANSSLAYVTKLQDSLISEDNIKKAFASLANADYEDQFDLYPLTTILVTTGINLNYDVFSKGQVWPARYSPIHKPFNLEHDQSKIIGHMTSSVAVDVDFNAIADDTPIEDIPDKFHVMTGAVIYKALSDKTAQEAIDKTIEEIEAGEWYVSMECLFSGFDYAVISAQGEQKIIERTESTAFLTKHLRQYGGSGSYNGFTLGRVLKNILFSGKGLVRKPANPESIIFSEDPSKLQIFNESIANLGYLTSSSVNNTIDNKDTNMANTTNTSTATASSDTAALDNKVSELEQKVKASSDSILSLETELTTKKETVATLESENATLKATVATLEVKVKELEDRASKAEQEILQAKAEIEAKEKARSRTERLLELNAPKEEAASIVSLFSDKNDSDFEKAAELFAPKWKTVPVETSAKATESVSTEVDQTALDTVEAEKDSTLATVVVTDEERVNNLSASLSKMFAGNKTSVKKK